MKKFEIRINAIMQQFFFTMSASSFALGLVIPLIAVFATNEIEGGNVKVAGIAAGISPLTQGVAQFASGFFLDKLSVKNKRMPFYFFIIRQFIDATYLLIMMFISVPLHLYLLQGIRGITSGVATQGGGVISIKYIDKGKEGTESGMANGIVNIFYGIGGILAGIIAASLGFKILFFAGSIFFLVSAIFAFKTLFAYNNAQKVQIK